MSTRIKAIGGFAYEAFGIWIIVMAITVGLLTLFGWLLSEGAQMALPLALFSGGFVARGLFDALRAERHGGW